MIHDAKYCLNTEEYKSNALSNLKQHSLLAELFGELLTKKITPCQTIDDLSEHQLIAYLCLGLHGGLKAMETLLRGAKAFANYSSFYKSIKKKLFRAEFYHILAELYAAEELAAGKLTGLEGKKPEVEFAPENCPKYDLIYRVDDKQYFAQVKSMNSLDPSMAVFSNEILKRSMNNSKYRKTMWDIKVNFSYRDDDFSVPPSKDVTKLEERIAKAITRTLNDWEIEQKESWTSKVDDIEISYKISEGKYNKPAMIYSKSVWSAQDPENMYLIFGRVYERLFHHAYSIYLCFKDLCNNKEQLALSRLMFVPDWANRSLYSFWEAPEFRKTAMKILDEIGVNNFMKVDILYGNKINE